MLHACWIRALSRSLTEEENLHVYTEEGDKGESKVEDNKHLLTLWIYTRIDQAAGIPVSTESKRTGSQGQRTAQMKKLLLSHCDMELLKMAMLRHEETFKQQVHELHRLYRVQKQLMGGGLSRPSSSELSCRRQIRRHRRQPRRALDLHLPADDECVVIAPPSADDDGLELTLAIGSSGGRGRRRRRDETTESTGTDTTPLGSESTDISGGCLTKASSSSTDTGGSPPPLQIQRAMPPAFRLQEAATPVPVPKVNQPPRSPWLVQCVSLEMA